MAEEKIIRRDHTGNYRYPTTPEALLDFFKWFKEHHTPEEWRARLQAEIDDPVGCVLPPHVIRGMAVYEHLGSSYRDVVNRFLAMSEAIHQEASHHRTERGGDA